MTETIARNLGAHTEDVERALEYLRKTKLNAREATYRASCEPTVDKTLIQILRKLPADMRVEE